MVRQASVCIQARRLHRRGAESAEERVVSLGNYKLCELCASVVNQNPGECKVMGLAPYGKPKYVQAIHDNLIDLKEDGTFRLKFTRAAYGSLLTQVTYANH